MATLHPPYDKLAPAEPRVSPALRSANPNVYAIFLALALTGYPLAGVVTSALRLDGSTISYGFRLLVILLSVGLSCQALLRGRGRFLPIAMLVLLGAYAVRLYYDAFIEYLVGADFALTFFLAVVLAPTLCAAIARESYDETRHALATFVIGATACVSIALLEWSNWGLSRGEAAGGRLGFDALNPITIGFTGLLTILAIIALWSRLPKLAPLFLVTGGFALYSLIQSGSRGPAAAGILAIALLGLARRNFALFGILLVVGGYLAFFAADANLLILERFQGVGTDASSEERLLFISNAIEQAWASPIFGHAYIETTTFNPPHNLVVEAGLALGVVGAALMLALMVSMAIDAWRLAAAGRLFLASILFTAFVNANLSASMWESVDFWIPLLLGHYAARRIATQRLGIMPRAAAGAGGASK